jgi:hypothetical protein
MKDLPNSEHPEDAIVVRNDFSDEAAWAHLCKEIETHFGEFRDYVSFVSDPDFEELDIDTLTSLGRRNPYWSCLFVVDRLSLTDEERPILVLDLGEKPGRAFRVIPREMKSIADNLAIANMDFYEFAESVDADGVFRGFH